MRKTVQSHRGFFFLITILLIALLVYYLWPHYQIVENISPPRDISTNLIKNTGFSTDLIENTGRSSLYCFCIMVSVATEQKSTIAHTVDGYLPRFSFFPNEGWQLVKEKAVDGHILSVYYYNTALRPGEASNPFLFNFDTNNYEEFTDWKENNFGNVYHCFPSILSAVANPAQMADWLLRNYKEVKFKQ